METKNKQNAIDRQFNNSIDRLAQTITMLCLCEGIINDFEDSIFENRMSKIADFSANFLVDKTNDEMDLYTHIYYLCYGNSFNTMCTIYTHYLQELKMQKYMINLIKKSTNNIC